jgi:FlaA1/EpsC-like NDP-sugar epimerase
VVFHAAAHKHVPILESAPEEAVKTNILGTANLLDGVGLYGTERFVLISTDKAVAPKNVMGASKRFAEMMIQSAAANRSGCIYAAVRFGNVLGTRGSVVPTFTQQILSGGPVTISDPAMTRYFMTVSEAVELVLQASAIADDGDVLVLDMGEPVKIMHLAHRMIRLAGLVPGRDIEVTITGARPGEKLNEELSLEPLTPSLHSKIWLVRPTWPEPVTLLDAVEQLERWASDEDREGVREMLFSFTSTEWGGNETVSLRLSEYSDVLDQRPQS